LSSHKENYVSRVAVDDNIYDDDDDYDDDEDDDYDGITFTLTDIPRTR